MAFRYVTLDASISFLYCLWLSGRRDTNVGIIIKKEGGRGGERITQQLGTVTSSSLEKRRCTTCDDIAGAPTHLNLQLPYNPWRYIIQETSQPSQRSPQKQSESKNSERVLPASPAPRVRVRGEKMVLAQGIQGHEHRNPYSPLAVLIFLPSGYATCLPLISEYVFVVRLNGAT